MRIEIWSDVVCPWCYIGKRRLATALSRFEHRDAVELEWRSFELDADAPARDPRSLETRLVEKYHVSPEEARAMNARVTAQAAQEGLQFRLDQARPANTFAAHRLTHFAGTQGRRAEMTESLFRAYFTAGVDLGDTEALLRLVREAGLDPDAARAALQSDAYVKAVRAEENRALEFGIQGVPYVAIDERFGVSGAQPVDTFLATLRKAWEQGSQVKEKP